MEKSDAKPTVVLSVSINCCNACPKKVKKVLLKVKGVESVDVDREKRLVSVTGKTDTNLLIKAIWKKMNKRAEVVPSKPKSENENEKNAKKSAEVEKEETANKTTKVDDGATGFDGEVCWDPYCTYHNYYPGMQEYGPMPPAPPPPPPPWMSYRQDEHRHP